MAYKSKREVTFYRFACGAPPYKQSRSQAAIVDLIRFPRKRASQGCGRNKHQDNHRKA